MANRRHPFVLLDPSGSVQGIGLGMFESENDAWVVLTDYDDAAGIEQRKRDGWEVVRVRLVWADGTALTKEKA